MAVESRAGSRLRTAPPRVTSAQAAAVATCVFCERPAGSVEYLWPEWLCRYFTETIFAPSHSTNDAVVARMRQEVDQTIDRICSSCLYGWMQRLDDDVIAFLPPMIRGDRTRLSPRQQAVLARWAAKTATVMDCVSTGAVSSPRAAGMHLPHSGVTAGTQVLLGRYDGEARVLSHDRDQFCRRIGGTERRVPQSTFVIGKVFLQVFADPWRDSPPEPVDDSADLLVALVPVHHRKVDWPPSKAIDDWNYDRARYGPA
jgi:hypothetical protein